MKVKKIKWVRAFLNGEDTSWYREHCIDERIDEELIMNNYILEFYLRFGIFQDLKNKGKKILDYSQYTYSDGTKPTHPSMFKIGQKTCKVKYCSNEVNERKVLNDKKLLVYNLVIFYNATTYQLKVWNTATGKITLIHSVARYDMIQFVKNKLNFKEDLC